MGYSKQHIEETKSRILLEAGRLIRKKGYEKVSVGEIMSAAGLTHGGFYAHFKSKEDLFTAVVSEEFDFANQVKKLLEVQTIPASEKARVASHYYLNPDNTEKVAIACTMASSAIEVARGSEEAKRGFSSSFDDLLTAYIEATGKEHSTETKNASMASLAMSVGGLILARAIAEPEASKELLGACATHLDQIMEFD